jgi:hypothetical protein
MRRGTVALVAFLAAILVADGPFDRAAAPHFPGHGQSVLSGAEIARIVAHANPSLSVRELDRIAGAIVRYSRKYALDPELVTAVLLVESNARPWVRSPKGAIGLMQVMPHMVAPLRLAGNAATIESNIEAGCLILASNIRRLGEDDGISAYFWGSEIRGVAYLDRVRAARAEVRRLRRS